MRLAGCVGAIHKTRLPRDKGTNCRLGPVTPTQSVVVAAANMRGPVPGLDLPRRESGSRRRQE